MDSRDWLERYNHQVEFEGRINQGWIFGGAKIVKEEAVQRLKVSGWGPVRRALAVTVR
jgi:hypothetical protein